MVLLVGRIFRYAPQACALLIASSGCFAETCGISENLFKSSLESGELPAITIPPPSTPVALVVTSPNDNATVGTRTIQVRGTWSGPANTGITINDKPALADFSSYASSDVVLSPGTNNISVVLTTQDGATQTISRTVNYDPQQAPDVDLVSNTSGDLSPLKASFSFVPKTGLTVTRIQADFDGGGSIDTDTTATSTPLSNGYLDPGTYDATFIVTIDDGDPMTPPISRTISHRVVVLNPNQIRQTLCQVYGDMRTRLQVSPSADISGALRTLHPTLQDRFQTLWTSLGSGLAGVVANLGDIADGQFSRTTADYLVIRPTPGAPTEFDGFHLQFELDDNGVWRITAM